MNTTEHRICLQELYITIFTQQLYWREQKLKCHHINPRQYLQEKRN